MQTIFSHNNGSTVFPENPPAVKCSGMKNTKPDFGSAGESNCYKYTLLVQKKYKNCPRKKEGQTCKK